MAKQKRKKAKHQSIPKTTVHQNDLGFAYNTSLHSIILFLLGFLLYTNTLTHDYTQDDAIVIYDNMFTTQGIKGIPGILKYDTFYGFFKEAGKANLVSGGRYRPLTLVMFAIEYQLFGKNPFIGHLINILLYGLLGVVLYLFLLKLLKPHYKNSLPYLIAFGASILYITHPIHTEVVANIKGRDEIVTLLCSLAALYYSLKAFDEQNNKYLLLVGVLVFLGLLSKEYPITFLAILPITLFVFRKATINQIAFQLSPYLLASVAFIFIRHLVLGNTMGGEPPMELMNNPFLKIVDGRYIPFSFGEQIATIFYTLGKYIQLLFFPHPLTHDYYPRQIEMMTFSNWKAASSLLLYIALGAYTVVKLFKKDPLAYGIAFFLITLSIVSNLFFPIGTNMAERFMFMPSVGFCLVIALFLYRFFLKKSPRNFTPYLGIIGVIAILFSLKTITRNFVWKDNYTLFTTDAKVSTNSAKLQNAVGGETIAEALKIEDEQKRNEMIMSSIPYLQKAAQIHPTYKNVYLLLGNAYYYTKDYDTAEKYYDQALRMDPEYKDALNNKVLLYEAMGVKYGVNNPSKALGYFKQAVAIQPENAKLQFFLGSTYRRLGQNQNAITAYEKTLATAPNTENHARIYNEIRQAYEALGNTVQAQKAAAKAKQYQ